MHFFSSKTRGAHICGFTLIELLISIAIITIITAIVVVRYKQFDSTVLLKGAAYEVSLAIRDVQIKSVGAQLSSGGVKLLYGIHFVPNQTFYKQFSFDPSIFPIVVTNTDPVYYDSVHTADMLTTTLERRMTISDICVTSGGTEKCSADGVTSLDISFQRPEFKALIYAVGVTPPSGPFTEAKIKINSATEPTRVFVVTVSQLGQVSVSKQ